MEKIYFREHEFEILNRFLNNNRAKAMAVYGRRRVGKTKTVLQFILDKENAIYFQPADSSSDYMTALDDFKKTIKEKLNQDPLLDSFQSFKDLFLYISRVNRKQILFIIDEFPYIARNNASVCSEFQWIIDHGLSNNKLILLGSSITFMKNQINDKSTPLYGRFDEIMELHPFSFNEVHKLIDDYDDAIMTYAITGGVPQYIMFFLDYPSVSEAIDALLLDTNGRLFQEPANLLRQELKDIGTYIRILRAIGIKMKEPTEIARLCHMESKNVYAYLSKLEDLELISVINNPLPGKNKNTKRYYIKDQFYRFMYTFIDPNSSVISEIGSLSRPYIFGDQYNEYLGIVYEEIIRKELYQYALNKVIPFMPRSIGKWWGNIFENGHWYESEIDILAIDDNYIIAGECKHRTKKIGQNELDFLKIKVNAIPYKDRKVIYLLASKEGFTDDIKISNDVLLIQKTDALNRISL